MPPARRARAGGPSPVPVGAGLSLLLLLATSTCRAFLLPSGPVPPQQQRATATHTLRPTTTAVPLPAGAAIVRKGLPALKAAAGAVDAKALEEWTQQWQKDNTKEGQSAPPPATVYPHTSLAEVLAEVFDQVLAVEQADKASPEKSQGRLLLFPECAALREGRMMQQFGDHLDLCKEVCEVLGVSQNAVSLHPAISGTYNCPVPAIYVKPIPQGNFDFPDDDPYWNDDEDDGAFGAWGDYEEAGSDDPAAAEYSKLYDVPEEDGPIMQGMRDWTDAVVADLGICPFTVSAAKAGLPMGSIRYFIDRSVSPEEIYARYWKEVALISSDSAQAQNEKQLSTTLLITPNFGLKNREYFETFSNTLTQPLEALGLEEEVQLVFFHPEWVFRDGADRMGSDGAANYARRSPWPMINILRTPQVRKAQKAIPTGLVYRQNEVTLNKIGSWRLQKWLVDRDWSEVKDNFRVDRKTVPILNTAQELLQGLSPQALSEADAADVVVAPPVLEGLEKDPGEVSHELHVKHARQAEEEEAAGVNVWGQGQEDDDDDDDWDTPLDTRQLVEVDEEDVGERVKRPYDEVVDDCKDLVAALRRRLSQNAPLTPAEIKQFEQCAERLRRDY